MSRSRKIEGQVLQSNITRRRNALARRLAARGVPPLKSTLGI